MRYSCASEPPAIAADEQALWTGEDPIVVLGVGCFIAPAQKIGDHLFIQWHRFFTFLCFDRTQMMLPNLLLHRLWVSGEVHEPLRNSNHSAMPPAA